MTASFNYSVVIPTYNRPKSLVRAINSVFNQTLRPKKIIVVDDGSTQEEFDAAYEIDKFSGVTFERLPENCGVSRARNVGIAISNSEFVLFLDDDDCWSPNHAECLYHSFKQGYMAVVSMSNRQRPDIGYRLADPSDQFRSMAFRTFIDTVSCFGVRSEGLQKVKGFNEDLRIVQDLELYLRLLTYSDIGLIREQTVCRSTQSESLTRNRIHWATELLDVLPFLSRKCSMSPAQTNALRLGIVRRIHKLLSKHTREECATMLSEALAASGEDYAAS